MVTFKRKCGGLDRWLQSGVWTFGAGMPPPPTGGRLISQSGWASRKMLERAEVGMKGTEVPQLWLCGGNGELAPVFQRMLIPNDAPTHLIRQRGCSVGRFYEDAYAEYALLTGVLPADASLAPERQTASVFDEMETALNNAEMDFSNVSRTWLYLDRILDWYPAFNQTRDTFFRSHKIYEGLVPASTGIGSANLCGTAITASAIAIKPKHAEAVTLQAVDSPLQCTAQAYGSSFSRAMEIGNPDYRILLVSGTAGIEPDGKTSHVGDVEGQLQLTLDVVEAILRSRGMDWRDTVRGVMYLKRPEFFGIWQAIAGARGLKGLPILTICADICRDDLLVELELDAVTSPTAAE